jgi:uncharacterized protein YlzI (FlbEa/FlbD family)
VIGVWLVASQLLVLHTLDGRDVFVAPSHIVSIVEARDESDPERHMTPKVHCAITMANSKIFTVAEDCASVRKRLEELR